MERRECHSGVGSPGRGRDESLRIYPLGPRVHHDRTNSQAHNPTSASSAMARIDPTRGVHLTLPLCANGIMGHTDYLGWLCLFSGESGEEDCPEA